jgi:hypothetical protein
MAALVLLGALSDTISGQFFIVYVEEAVQYVLHNPDYKDSVEEENEIVKKKIVSLNKKNCLIPNLILKCWFAWKTTTVHKINQLTHLVFFMPDKAKILRFLSMSIAHIVGRLFSTTAFMNLPL